MTVLARYHAALATIPPPGTGCHPTLLSVANIGVAAGIPAEQLFRDIRQAIPPGDRQIPDQEIMDAIEKASADHHQGSFIPRSRPAPLIRDGKTALRRLINQGTIRTEEELWEASPIKLLDVPEEDAALLLDALYQPTDLLFIGERHDTGILGTTIRPAEEWLRIFRVGGQTAPHILINPLTGIPSPKKTGDGTTLRGDASVAAYRYCVVEFDGLSREDQIRFWSIVKLPIVALIDSGGKSIHGWLAVAKLADVTTPDQWAAQIKTRLYERILIPLGVDSACSNPARLSRLPGHWRAEHAARQRLLWLSPAGRPVHV